LAADGKLSKEDSVRGESAIDQEAVKSVVERILLVPGKYRNFNISVQMAGELYCVSGDLLDQLLDLGLPHVGSGKDRRFNAADLENVGNALGLHFPGWRALRLLAITFGGMRSPGAEISYQVRASSKCPDPQHDGPCAVAPSPSLLSSGAQVLDCDSSGVTAQVNLPAFSQPLGTAIEPLVEIAKALTFHLIPNELMADVGFAAETGLADCRLSTAVLFANRGLIDLPVRTARGMIMSVPFMMRHTWPEIYVDARWKSIDPFFLNMLARWLIIDARICPPDTPTENVYWGISAESFDGIFLTTDHGARSHASARILNWREVFANG
jgi:hypothetical protein